MLRVDYVFGDIGIKQFTQPVFPFLSLAMTGWVKQRRSRSMWLGSP